MTRDICHHLIITVALCVFFLPFDLSFLLCIVSSVVTLFLYFLSLTTHDARILSSYFTFYCNLTLLFHKLKQSMNNILFLL